MKCNFFNIAFQRDFIDIIKVSSGSLDGFWCQPFFYACVKIRGTYFMSAIDDNLMTIVSGRRYPGNSS